MPSAPSGGVRSRNGSFYARVSYTDAHGKRKHLERKADSKTHAKQLVRELLNSIDAGKVEHRKGVTSLGALVTYYKDQYAHAPVIVNGEKVSGMASWVDVVRHCETLLAHFGDVRLSALTYGALERYKRERLKTKNARGTTYTPASIHRELATLRTMLNVAKREKWISRNPFEEGASLIQNSIEERRDRVLTSDEEARLLAACRNATTVETSKGGKKVPVNIRRGHLRPLVIAALDTGARKTELLELRWNAVDFASGRITFRTLKQRREKFRVVGITKRLREELEALWEKSPKIQTGKVFGVADPKTAWEFACKEAQIEGLRFHDLRHTCGTRLAHAGVSLSEIARLLGHEQVATTFGYLHLDETTADRAAAALDARFTPPAS